MSDAILRDEHGVNQIFAPVGSTLLRMERRSNFFLDEMKALGARRVLEIGAGSGDNAAHLAQHSDAEIVAVDISASFVERARQNHQAPNLRFEKFDLFTDDLTLFGSFDLVCGNGILHHLVKDLDKVLRAMRALTNKGGGFAFIEPNFLNPYCAFAFGTKAGRKFARLDPDEMAFKPWALRRAIEQAGWRDVKVAMRDFLVPGVPEWSVKPILAVEPVIEATPLTRWLAQSHFATARA